MRAHHVITVIVVLVTALGAKLFLFPPKQADAGPLPGVSMNVHQMERELNMKDLPVQDIRDKTFVFENE
jgi:hypothetical protein